MSLIVKYPDHGELFTYDKRLSDLQKEVHEHMNTKFTKHVYSGILVIFIDILKAI